MNHPSQILLERIVCGGQSGVDRAALDAAIARQVEYGGWCPQGGWAEDLPTPPGLLARYANLRETPSADPQQRTEWNVRDSDATLIIVAGAGLTTSGGTRLTSDLAARYDRPRLILPIDVEDQMLGAARWLRARDVRTLNVAGPRESECPGIYTAALRTLAAILDLVAQQ